MILKGLCYKSSECRCLWFPNGTINIFERLNINHLDSCEILRWDQIDNLEYLEWCLEKKSKVNK